MVQYKVIDVMIFRTGRYADTGEPLDSDSLNREAQEGWRLQQAVPYQDLSGSRISYIFVRDLPKQAKSKPKKVTLEAQSLSEK